MASVLIFKPLRLTPNGDGLAEMGSSNPIFGKSIGRRWVRPTSNRQNWPNEVGWTNFEQTRRIYGKFVGLKMSPKMTPESMPKSSKIDFGWPRAAKCRFRILTGLRERKLIFSTIFEAVKIRQNLIIFVFCSLLGARGACRPGQHGCGDGKRIFFESWLFFCCSWLVRLRKLVM